MPFKDVNGDVYDSLEDMMAALSIEEIGQEEWNMMKAKDKSSIDYTPKMFLDKATKYWNGELTAGKPDLVQASEKLWLAAAYTVKIYFLELPMKVLLASHRSLRYFCPKACAVKEVKTELELNKAWELAEDHHRYAYGKHKFTKAQFEANHKKISFFVEEFPNIDKNAVEEMVKKVIADLKEKESEFIAYKPFDESVNPKLGGKDYYPDHKFY